MAKPPKKITDEYRAWQEMKKRCNNPNVKAYKYYGARGIKVCDRWLNSFENFYTDLGPKPSKDHSLDRKDSNGNYEPDNCRWATKIEQMNNTSLNRLVEYNGKTQTFAQWSRELNFDYDLVELRMRRNGWSFEKATTTPKRCNKIEFDGKSLTLPEWSKELGIDYKALYHRLYGMKWSIEKSLGTPLLKNYKK